MNKIKGYIWIFFVVYFIAWGISGCKVVQATEITNVEFAYKVNNCVETLYTDVDNFPIEKQVPIELIIAQAAHESGWGTSRFAVEGNNLFGIRTWNPEDPQLKAKGAPDASWGLRSYKSWCDSITHYLHILNTYPAYEPFRDELAFQIEISLITPINLTLYLEPWSEQGQEYVRLLQSVMLSLYKKEFFNQLIQGV
tara:strand:+ start:1478 stop:2065 length:588 start_codon:yes stop_codon:yes gene_type:complete